MPSLGCPPWKNLVNCSKSSPCWSFPAWIHVKFYFGRFLFPGFDTRGLTTAVWPGGETEGLARLMQLEQKVQMHSESRFALMKNLSKVCSFLYFLFMKSYLRNVSLTFNVFKVFILKDYFLQNKILYLCLSGKVPFCQFELTGSLHAQARQANSEDSQRNSGTLLASPTGLSPYLRFGCLSCRLVYSKFADLYGEVRVTADKS